MNFKIVKSVISINDKGLHYIDRNGEEGFVDFEIANKGWRTYLAQNQGIKPEMITSNGVGWRDACARPMYIEFFCEPHVRIDFNLSKLPWKKKVAVKSFVELHKTLTTLGWSTLDLS